MGWLAVYKLRDFLYNTNNRALSLKTIFGQISIINNNTIIIAAKSAWFLKNKNFLPTFRNNKHRTTLR